MIIEFYDIKHLTPSIALVMMVKNEEKRIHVSLESCLNTISAIIIYDTGSTDNTINIIKEFSEKNKINLYLIQGEFVDFSTSRNVLLEYADTIQVDYLLLLDCNDELINGKELKNYAALMINQKPNAFLICQQWYSGALDKYYNIRFLKPRSGWRYFGSVHEWLKDTSVETPEPKYPLIRMPDDFYIYQDRSKDDDKSLKRFWRDKELLLADLKKNPKDSRAAFYLAQTFKCLCMYEESLYYSKLRIELDGFDEERFHSFIRAGDCAISLGHSWEDIMGWYIKAYQHSIRAEPLTKIADCYLAQASFHMKIKSPYAKNYWKLAYMFIREACELEYPEDAILFVDRGVYIYYRWHLMGRIAFYVGKYEEGKQACIKAIAEGTNKELNEFNLKMYTDYFQNLKKNSEEKLISELEKKFPNISKEKLRKRNKK